jgi:hypothetical protein
MATSQLIESDDLSVVSKMVAVVLSHPPDISLYSEKKYALLGS